MIVCPPPHLQRTPVFLRSQTFFSCDRRFARRIPFRFASGLLKSDLNLAKTRKRRRFFFLAALVSRREVSDVSRNIANSGPSKGGLEAKKDLKRQRGCKNKKRSTPQRPQRLFRASGAWSRVILTFSCFFVKNLALVRKNDHSGQRLGPKNVHDTAATEPLRRLSLSHCSDLTAFLFLRHLSRFNRLSKKRVSVSRFKHGFFKLQHLSSEKHISPPQNRTSSSKMLLLLEFLFVTIVGRFHFLRKIALFRQRCRRSFFLATRPQRKACFF